MSSLGFFRVPMARRAVMLASCCRSFSVSARCISLALALSLTCSGSSALEHDLAALRSISRCVELLEEFQLRLYVLVHLAARVRPHGFVAVLGNDGQLLQQRFKSLLRRVRYQRHHFRVCVAQPVLRSNFLNLPLQGTSYEKVLVLTGPNLGADHFCRAENLLRFFSQIDATHSGYVVDVVITTEVMV